ncbi:hypothetical protein [Jeotgalibacillus aurantiacus]|uniref:hypothetical protein n=1 Tax=Jeotgalibacillus aurantiacus TaxID=2763266 RepID=UPI001D0B0F8C|nr:hypothetical protein [Jeotgalibacillus aurantiacus]
MTKAKKALAGGMTAAIALFISVSLIDLDWALRMAVPVTMVALSPYLIVNSKEKQKLLISEASESDGKSVMSESEWIFQRESTVTSQLTILNKEGQYIGCYRLVNNAPLKKVASLIFSGADAYYSFTAGVFDSHGKPVLGFQKRKEDGHTILEVRDQQAETIGFFKEARLQMIKMAGTFQLADGSTWFQAKSSSMVGDFTLADQSGRFIASYRHGYFDYALKEPFKHHTPGYDLVKVNENLTDHEKVLVAAVISYWMSYLLRGR